MFTEEECILCYRNRHITVRHLPYVQCYLQSLLYARYYLSTTTGKLHKRTVKLVTLKPTS